MDKKEKLILLQARIQNGDFTNKTENELTFQVSSILINILLDRDMFAK